MSVTIQEIAKQSGVSTSTVSKVLNNREGISDSVRIKVLKTAERLGYFPYLKARETGLFKRKQKYIAEIFGKATPYLINEISNGLTSIINNSRFYEIKFMVQESKSEKIELFFDHIIRDQDIAGVIISFLEIDDKIINNLIKNNIYVIFVNSRSEIAPYVTVDNIKASCNITEHLIKAGCRNIGLIIPDNKDVSVWLERKEGYKKALLNNGLVYNPELIEYENSFQIEMVKLATEALLKRNPEIDGIIYASDLQAYAGLKYLKEKGIKVPQQICIAGFDNLEFSELIEPSLTSVDQPMYKMGEIAGKHIIKMIKEKRLENIKETLDTRIIVRETTKRR